MKRLMITAFFLGLIATGCSSDDNNSDDADSANIYLPLVAGNFWTYDVETSAGITRDSLYVAEDVVVNALDYKKMRTLETPSGFYSGSMNNNAVRKTGSSVVMTGSAAINFPGVTPIAIALSDFVVFRENANEGDQLSSVSDETIQDLQGLPVTLQYTLKSLGGATMATFTVPGGATYTDVKIVKVVMNLRAFTPVATFPVDILSSQDVLVSNQYYAKNIGMVYASTTFSYNLQDLSALGITLPIPQSMTQVATEKMDTYQAE